jgi:aldehyde dehydrogenase (NAD+)
MAISTQPFLDGKPKQLMIDGASVDATTGRYFETVNPATGEVLAQIAEGDAADVDRAVAAARAAFEGPWRKAKPFDRQAALLRLAELVDKHFDELAILDTLEMGAPLRRTVGNRARAIGLLRYYAAQAVGIRGDTIENSLPGDYVSYTLKEPVGVVAAITPWNGPTVGTILKLGPVIATGCTMVLKPSEEASLAPLRLAELCLEAGIPKGVFNVVTGFGHTAGAALASHPDVNKVSFTGSYLTGQKIAQASTSNLKRVTLELGGKSPDVVFADADLDAAVPGAGMACFSNSGQICCAGTRLFVERPIYEEFTARVAEFGKTLRLGHGSDPETDIGPLVSSRQLERVTSYLEIGHTEGARALTGGTRSTEGNLAQGYFVPPTVFADVKNDMRIAQEEIFGPVLSAIPFDNIDEAIEMCNRTIYGLGSGLWTRDVTKAHRMARGLRAGSVWINCYLALDPAVPFGGVGMSGYGREMGPQHIDEYLDVKSVWTRIA